MPVYFLPRVVFGNVIDLMALLKLFSGNGRLGGKLI